MLHFPGIAVKLRLDSSFPSKFPKATSKDKQEKDTSAEIRNDIYLHQQALWVFGTFPHILPLSEMCPVQDKCFGVEMWKGHQAPGPETYHGNLDCCQQEPLWSMVEGPC